MLTNKLIKTIQLIIFLTFGCTFSNAVASSTISCNHLYEEDFQAALKQCIDKVKRHSSTASVILAQMYEKGVGVEKNINKAESYYLIAVLDNDIDAQIALGKLQAKENKDLQSYIFFSLAANNGSLYAMHLRDSAKKNLSAEEVSLSTDFINVVEEAMDNNKSSMLDMSMAE